MGSAKGKGWSLAAAMGSLVLGVSAFIPASFGSFSATAAGASSGGSGTLGETLDSSCSANDITGATTTCASSLNLLAQPGYASNVSIANTGSVGEPVTIATSSCGVASLINLGSNGGPTLAHGGFSLASYHMPQGPLGGVAISFGGKSQFASLDGSAASGSDPLTLLAWFEVAPTQGGAILSFGNSPTPTLATATNDVLWIDPSGYMVAGVDQGSIAEVKSKSAVNDGVWHLASLTVASRKTALYIDGRLQQEVSTPAAAMAQLGWWALGAGNMTGWPDSPATASGVSYLNGSLAGLAVLPVALTPSEIDHLSRSVDISSYDGTLSSYGPQDLWPLQDQGPTVISQLSGQTSVCDSLQVSAFNQSTQSCIYPALGSGIPCPSALTGLTLAKMNIATLVEPQTATNLVLSVSEISNVSPALRTADIIAAIRVDVHIDSWYLDMLVPNSESQL